MTVHIETRLKGRKQLLPNETEMMTLIDELKEEVRAVIMSNTGIRVWLNAVLIQLIVMIKHYSLKVGRDKVD